MKIEWNRKIYRVVVTRVKHGRVNEIFEIKGRNKIVRVQSNKPWLEHKSLHNWMPEYKIMTPRFATPGFETSLLKALQEGVTAYNEQQVKERPGNDAALR